MTTEESVILQGATEAPERSSTPKKIGRILGWSSFTLLCVLMFTLLKLPEDRIKNFVHGTISSALSTKGITLSAAETDFSILFGLSYSMKDVTLNFPPPQPSVKIDEIEISPSLFPLLFGKVGGKFWLQQGDGSLKGAFTYKSSRTDPAIDAWFKAEDLHLGRLGALALAANIKGSAIVSGAGSVSGSLASPESWNGEVNLKLSKIVLDQQPIYGFSVPRLTVSEGIVDLLCNRGKIIVKSLRLGKTTDGAMGNSATGGGADDLTALVQGDVLLGKQWESSTLNLKTKFGLSDTLLKSFVLIDALLAGGKQGDGSYAFNLSGPIYSPIPTPVSSGK